MLIRTDRHTAADLALWAELEESDILYYETHNMEYRESRAIQEIKDFSTKGPFYASVSWGKDSVTVLHLCLRALGHTFPIVCSRGTYRTRAANAMYLDDVMAAFPGYPRENYVEIRYPEWPPHSKEKSLRDYEKTTGVTRRVSGVRAAESGMRKQSRCFHGVSTEVSCRPIIDWPTAAVFAYCAHYRLPLHPDYGMLGGGRWGRERIRVGGSVGGEDGTSFGRAEWEREYYPDVLARVQARGVRR